MGKKNKNNNNEGGEEPKMEGEKKNNLTVVLKVHLHCEGCATKIINSIRSFHGVDSAIVEDGEKITVVGTVDPVKLRDKVERKTHKKVELISPLPPKKDDGGGGDSAKQEKKKESKGKNASSKEKSDEKKSKEKEPPVTTVVLKLHLHCDGCIEKIYKTVSKTAGYREMKIDEQKDLVTVTGAMDMKALAEVLQKQLKRNVEIVPPKKEGEKKEKGGGEGEAEGGGEEKMDGNKMMFQGPYPLMYGSGDQFNYTHPYAAGPYHAPQIFSDENPNACSVM